MDKEISSHLALEKLLGIYLVEGRGAKERDEIQSKYNGNAKTKAGKCKNTWIFLAIIMIPMRPHERFPTLARERSSTGHVIFLSSQRYFWGSARFQKHWTRNTDGIMRRAKPEVRLELDFKGLKSQFGLLISPPKTTTKVLCKHYFVERNHTFIIFRFWIPKQG